VEGEPDVGSGKNDSYVFIIIYQMSLIVFEGVDRCGKSTQIKMLANGVEKARKLKCLLIT
jgi:hypothetical protein